MATQVITTAQMETINTMNYYKDRKYEIVNFLSTMSVYNKEVYNKPFFLYSVEFEGERKMLPVTLDHSSFRVLSKPIQKKIKNLVNKNILTILHDDGDDNTPYLVLCLHFKITGRQITECMIAAA